MKLKLNLVSVGAIIAFVLSIVMMGLFLTANTTSQGNFEAQYNSVSYVVAFCVVACILSLAIILLPMISLSEKAEKVMKIVVNVCVIAVSVFLCLAVVYVLKASVYEIAITFGSELHKNEPFMTTACNNAITSVVCGLVGMLILSILTCIPLKNFIGK